nr:MAG TPA: hypothetical protein [Caudoviricetes sp.]
MTDYKAIAQMIIDDDPACIGVRSLQNDEKYEVGDYCRESYEWDYENDCSTYHSFGEDGEKAGGTCATHVRFDTWDVDELAAEIEKTVKANAYYGRNGQVIITGRPNIDGSFDKNECRIVDAKVIAVVD